MTLLYPNQPIILLDDDTAEAYYSGVYSEDAIYASVRDCDGWAEVILDRDEWALVDEDTADVT